MLNIRQEPFNFHYLQRLGLVPRAKGVIGIEACLSIPCAVMSGQISGIRSGCAPHTNLDGRIDINQCDT